MLPAAWNEWVESFYEQCGRRLDDFDPVEEPNWETENGEYTLLTDEDMVDEDDPLMTTLRQNETEEERPLPEGFQNIRLSQLGVEWIIDDNWSRTEACLKNVRTRKQQYCQGMFEDWL